MAAAMPRRRTTAKFKGITFRSHTECRWAMFFEHLDIEWDYESQGFADDDEAYLPDFSVKCALGVLWVEVKGAWESDSRGVAKWRRWAPEREQPSRTVLLSGPPSLEGKWVVIGGDDDSDDPLKGGWEDDTQQWRPCGSGEHFDLCYPGLFRAKFVQDGCADSFGGGGKGEDRLREAVEAANSYRFGRFGSPPSGAAA
jgi:hypothetical protein